MASEGKLHIWAAYMAMMHAMTQVCGAVHCGGSGECVGSVSVNPMKGLIRIETLVSTPPWGQRGANSNIVFKEQMINLKGFDLKNLFFFSG